MVAQVAAPAPSAPDAAAFAGLTGSDIDFASLLSAQFGELQSADTDEDLAAVAAPGLDLASLLNGASAIDTPLPQVVPVSATVANGAAGTDVDAASPGNLLQAIGEAKSTLTADVESMKRFADDATAAKFAATDLPESAIETTTTASGESQLTLVQHGGNTRGNTPNGTSALPAPRIDTAFGDARWGSDFSQKIVWLARQDIQSAQISINPPNLGPIDVSLQLGPDQATAVFSSPHAEVREALESALPRLREMLAGAGISLGQAQVGSQSQQQATRQDGAAGGESPRVLERSILAGASEVRLLHPPRNQHGIGLVDTFA